MSRRISSLLSTTRQVLVGSNLTLNQPGPSRFPPTILHTRLASTSSPTPTRTAWKKPKAIPGQAEGSSAPSTQASGLAKPAHEYHDGDIPFQIVQMVDPTTNSLREPQTLRSLLRTYDKGTHSLRLVSTDPPVVKLLNLDEERRKNREAEARSKIRRKVAIENKEVQVSWSSAEGDLKHKAALAKSILDRGDRVELVFAPKQASDKIDEERKLEIIGMFQEVLEESGVQWREDDKRKGAWVCYWQPKSIIRDAVRDKVMEEEIGKRKEKDEKKEARRKKEEDRRQRAAAQKASQST